VTHSDLDVVELSYCLSCSLADLKWVTVMLNFSFMAYNFDVLIWFGIFISELIMLNKPKAPI